MSSPGTGTVVRGRVAAVLPRGLFAVRTGKGDVVAGLGRQAVHVVRVKPGDTVLVRLSPRDPRRGRIVGTAGPGDPLPREDGR